MFAQTNHPYFFNTIEVCFVNNMKRVVFRQENTTLKTEVLTLGVIKGSFVVSCLPQILANLRYKFYLAFHFPRHSGNPQPVEATQSTTRSTPR